MISSRSHSGTFDEETRPFATVSSWPSQVQSSVASVELPVSQWATVLTFVLGDLVGVLSVLGSTQLLASWLLETSAYVVYDRLFLVIGGMLLVYAAAGLYRRRFTHPALEMQRIGGVTLFAGAISGGVAYTATGVLLPAVLLLLGGVLGAIVMPVCRALFRILFARTSWWGFPAVVVTSDEGGSTIRETLRRWPEIGVRPVAVLNESFSVDVLEEGPIRGGHDLVPYLADQFDIPYVILALPGLTHSRRAKVVSGYSKFFDHVFVVGDATGSPALWTTGRSGDGLFGYGVQNVAAQPAAWFIKRSVDVIGAALGLVFLAPFLGLIALLVKMDSQGSVFYRQERMGQEGRIVTILKFRTMYEDADQKLEALLDENEALRREYEQYHKLSNDPRVTPIGKFLRRYSLDELPQIINVLWGDMSLVGPRAYMPSELDKMQGLARSVLQSPPGITGLWQVSGRNHLSFAERVNLDVHYIQNWSPWLDLYLLVRTGPVVLSGDGAS